jgi:hypothetical protein
MRAVFGLVVFRCIASFMSAVLRLFWAIGAALASLIRKLVVPTPEDRLRRIGQQHRGGR